MVTPWAYERHITYLVSTNFSQHLQNSWCYRSTNFTAVLNCISLLLAPRPFWHSKAGTTWCNLLHDWCTRAGHGCHFGASACRNHALLISVKIEKNTLRHKAQCASTNQYGVCCHMTRSTVPDDATTWFRAPFIRDGGISPIASVVLWTRHEKTCRVHCCSSDIHDKSWKQVQGLWCGADTPLCSFHDDALVSDVAREFAPISSFHSRKKHALRFQLSVLNGRTMKF